ncbi:MAG TPA: AAA family ATPase [Solirubrobacteraceae bacterium]|jgi:DNA polymerase-3 subunit delta'|nr:AAA family ATPase [Solirubrobacteraceae bacterium]
MPAAQPVSERTGALLEAVAPHPHARAVLGPVLGAGGSPSHAYLFHGPAGTGKRAAARAFAAALLAEDSPDPVAAAERATRGTHPDLTWVAPSGAAEMLVSDVEEPVVAAATRTPFESARRVFVIEQVDTMNDQAANRLLKTLEEPPSFVHVVLLTDRRSDVLPTIVSRCQLVRFDPLPAAAIAERIPGSEGEQALACARLAQGDAAVAATLASATGASLRSAAEGFARAALAGDTAARPWLALLDAAKGAAADAGERMQEELEAQLELVPPKERKRIERDAADARRRGERRARTRTLDLGLRLAELWLRDVLCAREGAPELVLACDRAAEVASDADGRASAGLLEAIALVSDARLSLALNVSEELALEALAYRLQDVLA